MKYTFLYAILSLYIGQSRSERRRARVERERLSGRKRWNQWNNKFKSIIGRPARRMVRNKRIVKLRVVRLRGD